MLVQDETFTDHILKRLEQQEAHQHHLVLGYCQECQEQIEPRYYRAAIILGDAGQAISEYAMLLSFVLLVVLASAMQVSNAVYNVFDRVGSHIFGHIR